MKKGHEISSFGTATRLTMLGRDTDEQHGFVNPPLYRGSTVVHKTVEDVEQRRGRFFYGTAGTPTIASLEDAWTQLTGAHGTVLSPSGLGSVALALMSTTKAGDHVLIPDSVYGPSRNFCDAFLRKFGVDAEYYDPMIGAGIAAHVRSNTSTILMESPGSQTMEIQDVPALVRVAKKHGLKTILDNTWATPVFFDAHGNGIDISVEAGTKYLGGHSDLLLGLASANQETWPALRATYDAMAMLPGAEDCLLALRGLRTLHLRLKEAERKGLELAAWLKSRPEVAKVLHPALEECPGHEIWRRDFRGSSGVFSAVLNDGFSRAGFTQMLEGMSIFAMGYSWGGYESLIVPLHPQKFRTVTTWPAGFAFRIQTGLEDLEDLKADLLGGLERLRKPSDD
ncbi:cystathionine beta-lyase [Pseudomonas amygdali]|uniref:cystathionine beta-lyase n=1 Tax=Pseudomonas amygdali TaxID=47877 RepID=UPI001FB624C7|nr:cystathionine beta-lyase [Pseudomonas amygdali]UPT36777.1 cystathionine beta-lyase [Pseudomonas amygdali pv. loropetali]